MSIQRQASKQERLTPNVSIMLGQRLRLWPNITDTLGERIVFAGGVHGCLVALSSPRGQNKDNVECVFHPGKHYLFKIFIQGDTYLKSYFLNTVKHW